VKELKSAGLLDTRPAIDVYSSRAPQDELPFQSIESAAEDAEGEVEPLDAEEGAPADDLPEGDSAA